VIPKRDLKIQLHEFLANQIDGSYLEDYLKAWRWLYQLSMNCITNRVALNLCRLRQRMVSRQRPAKDAVAPLNGARNGRVIGKK
jgi:hypothetical protein